MSSVESQNDGTTVENSVVGVADLSSGGYLSLVVNVPWMLSPVEVMDLTFPACT